MRRTMLAGLLAATVSAACNDTAVVIRVSSDRGIGAGGANLEAICVELDAGGAARFGRRYDLAARPLPQTLTALAGGRDAVQVIVRGLQSGVEAARARTMVPFRSGEILHVEAPLDLCLPAPTRAHFSTAGGAFGGAAERAVLAPFPSGGGLAVALAAGASARASATDQGLAPLAGGAPSSAGAVNGVVAGDLDGDCRPELVVSTDGAAASLWSEGPDGRFAAQGVTLAPGAAAIGDVDGDGNPDLAIAGGAAAHLYLGDGGGRFREASGAFDVAPADATAIALGDLDGDGRLDAVIGQRAGETRVYLNQGGGHLAWAPAALPPRALTTTALALVDLDADGDLDLVEAGLASPVRVYLNRGNAFLEDRSFSLLPDQTAGDVPSLLAADLNDDCLPDLVVPRAGGAPLLWLNAGGGRLVAGPALPVGEVRGAAADDVDGDGAPDLLFYGSRGLELAVQK